MLFAFEIRLLLVFLNSSNTFTFSAIIHDPCKGRATVDSSEWKRELLVSKLN